MNTEKVKSEVLNAESELLTALRSGDFVRGVGMHSNSPDYRNIWNGEIKTHQELEARIKMGVSKGLKSIDYQVLTRDFSYLDVTIVLETLTATETTNMQNGSSVTSGVTAISILWRLYDGKWRLGYLHASELPKEN